MYYLYFSMATAAPPEHHRCPSIYRFPPLSSQFQMDIFWTKAATTSRFKFVRAILIGSIIQHAHCVENGT